MHQMATVQVCKHKSNQCAHRTGPSRAVAYLYCFAPDPKTRCRQVPPQTSPLMLEPALILRMHASPAMSAHDPVLKHLLHACSRREHHVLPAVHARPQQPPTSRPRPLLLALALAVGQQAAHEHLSGRNTCAHAGTGRRLLMPTIFLSAAKGDMDTLLIF